MPIILLACMNALLEAMVLAPISCFVSHRQSFCTAGCAQTFLQKQPARREEMFVALDKEYLGYEERILRSEFEVQLLLQKNQVLQ